MSDSEQHTVTGRQLSALMAPLNPDRVQGRKQGGRTLSYLEAWDVKASLIRLFGFGGFSATVSEQHILNQEVMQKRAQGGGYEQVQFYPNGDPVPGSFNYRVTATVKVTLTIPALNAEYSEYAAASQTGPDYGEVADFAIKTAESDALKRAAIYLGTQFGLSLYDNGSTRDVVRTLLEPTQSALLETYMVERNAAAASQMEAATAQVQSAFGAAPVASNEQTSD